MTGGLDYNVDPYYDDYDENDGYHRILFRPSRSVQARELTQLQTILQNQIKRFGQNVFKDGTVVVPGGISIDTNYEYVKLQGSPDLSTIELAETLTGATSGNTAVLLQEVEEDSVDPATFYVQYTGGGRFTDGETLNASGGGSFTVAASSATGQGTKVNLDKGIFFVKGYFIAATTQSLIIEKYGTPAGTSEVGITTSESIITSATDTDLLSNAAGTTNENAPGADRLKITATLTEKSSIEESNGETSEDYISLALIVDGVIREKYLKTQYNILGDEFAKRTFEESGNYTVDPFILTVEDHSSDNTKLDLEIDPGIAYVKGYRVDKALTSNVDLDKALTTSTVANANTATFFGNYVRTGAPTYLPRIGTFETVNLKDSGASVIGTARIRAVEKESAGAYYRFFLFDVAMTGGNTFNEVRTLEDTSADGGTFTATLIGDDNASLSTDIAELKRTDRNNLLFLAPQSRIKDMSDITATVQRYTTGTTNGSGEVTLDTGDSTITWADTSDWLVIRQDTGALVTPTFGSSGAQTILLSGLNASTAHTIIAYVEKTSATTNVRTKTLQTKTDQALSALSGSTDILLDEADIVAVTAIKDAADDTDITDRYIVDNGQRDNFYGEGKLILKTGETAPTGDSVSDVLVTFTYFDHGTGSYFNVDSYDTFVSGNSYADIPTHTMSDGTVIRLHDYWDFRPRYDDDFVDFSTTGSIINELPKNNETIQADIEYYLPRIDTLYIDSENNFGVAAGVPSLDPRPSEVPANAMPLYTISLNAGTYDRTDVATAFVENKRYTMRDIGRIESRINRLEEWSTLSLLEVEADTLQVLDNSGNNRFKTGFFVDNFKSHSFSDTDNTNGQYRAGLDLDQGHCRPSPYEHNARLTYVATDSDSNSSSNVVQKGDLLLLSYTEEAEFTQPYATESINVNPYSVSVYAGSITLSPTSDEWRDVENTTRTVTNIVQNNPVNGNAAFNDGNWNWNWFGVPNLNFTLLNNGGGLAGAEPMFVRTPRNIRVDRATQMLEIAEQGQGAVRETSETRTVNIRMIPFIRSRKVYFKAEGLLPNTTHTPYFNGVDVTEWCREESFTRVSSSTVQDSVNENEDATEHPDGQTALITDSDGAVEGTFFIPNNSTRRFRTGKRSFHLWDDQATAASNALSKAYATYHARGTLETTETVITREIIRPAVVVRPAPPQVRWFDPVAQSFLIENEEGAFITSVDIPFKTASSTLPIRCQIRPMSQGLPTNETIAEKFLPASAFTGKTSNTPSLADSSTYVTFTFDEPVHVNPNEEYCIVLITDSDDYQVWTAVTGDFEVGSTTRRVMQQPTLGSFFKSQNASTWTPDQSRDMMFRLNRAKFTTSAATGYFENVDLPLRKLPDEPLSTTNSSGTVYVKLPNHGLTVGSVVTLSGLTATNGIDAANMNGQRTVTYADDHDWFGFTAGASDTASSTGGGGGTAGKAYQNYMFDISYTSVNNQTFQSAAMSFAHKTTSGQSKAGAETAYARDASFENMIPNFSNKYETMRMVASAENETASMSGKRSYTLRATMQTTNDYVSPVIDLQRLSLTTIGKRIDRPAASATTGFNLPRPSFVAETDANDGSAESKHVAVPVTLETDAIGLHVIFAANRPADATLQLFYRVAESGDDTSFNDISWTEATIDETIQSDENPVLFRDYKYTIESDPFTRYQLKVVMTSKNEAKYPTLKDLRVIALAT